MAVSTKSTAGLQIRHRKGCPAPEGKRCRCRPSYRTQVWDAETKRPRKGPWFPTAAAARGWKVDAQRAQRHPAPPDDTSRTIEEALREVLDAAEQGHVRNRSGGTFKPSVLRSYREAADGRLAAKFGSVKLGELTQPDLYAWARDLLAEGLSPSTVRNALMPLRLVYREAVAHGEVQANPTAGLRLPASGAKRERIASPDEAERLLAALPEQDRPLWATALYAGLRRGELAALRWRDVGAAGDVIRVDPERGSYDHAARKFGPPKSKAAVRSVPITARLRPHLAGRGADDALVFGRDASTPFAPKTVATRAARAWKAANDDAVERAEQEGREAGADELLEPIGLHEARHTFASYLIASGANAKAVTTALGHSSVSITFDRYGHLFPGHEDELRDLLDAYLPADR